jgi:hypothetical protein
MVSGFGQLHTNEADPLNPQKRLTPYKSIAWAEIQSLVDTPQSVPKEQARWVIPSTLITRNGEKQKAGGSYWMLWADLDKEVPSLSDVDGLVVDIIGTYDREIHTSRSATPERQKAHMLIPLKAPLAYGDWRLAAEVLNDKLEAAGLIPDRKSEVANQLCYLPNRGTFYDRLTTWRFADYFDPLVAWSAEIAQKRDQHRQQAEALQRQREAARERREARAVAGTPATVLERFNESFLVEDVLLRFDYDQHPDGASFRHPASESGSYSAKVRGGRVHTLSSSDPLYTGGGGGGAHDAFGTLQILGAGGDVAKAMRLAEEWLVAAGREALPGFSDQSTPNGPPTQQNATTAVLKPPAPLGFQFVSVSDLLAAPVPVDWLIDEMLEAGTLAMLFGASKSGKSFAALDWSACIATGRAWNGRDVAQGPVFYLAGEGKAGIGRRLKAWELHNGVSLTGAPLHVSKVPAALIDSGNAAAVAEGIAPLVASYGPPRLIVVDTLARNLGDGEESSNADMGRFIQNLDVLLKARFHAAVLIVHHTGHMEGGRARGASALTAAMDHEFRMEHDPKTGIRQLHVTKSKEAELPDLPMSFCVEHVELPGWLDTKGRQISSGVLVAAEFSPVVVAPVLTGARRAAMDALQVVIEREGVAPDAEVQAAAGSAFFAPSRVVTAAAWRKEACDQGISGGGVHAQRKAFDRARDSLVADGLVAVAGAFCWRS